MTTPDVAPAGSAGFPASAPAARGLAWPLVAGVFAWLALAGGFLGLRMLMLERPQFVGPPLRIPMTALEQESPRIVSRRAGDDVAAIRALQPESSEVTFDLRGHRDHRGLKTVVGMAGSVLIRHVLTNAQNEPAFILFRCPHPHAGDGSAPTLQASALKLRASRPGTEENTPDAWIWSGELPSHAAVTVEVSYQAAALRGVSYRLHGVGSEAVKHLRIGVQRTGLEALRLETGEGQLPDTGGPLAWERRDFLGAEGFTATIVEGRSLHESLLQLLEIGPLVCLLFLVAVAAAVGAHRPLTVAQVFTLGVGHALYFPLMVYLSARFSFAVALTLAAVVPGGLLVNYARVQWGSRAGLLGGPAVLALYQLFPTLAAFAGWNRGLVLLCLGLVTFAVLIHLQNRTLKRLAAVALLFTGLPHSDSAHAAEFQVLVPAQLTAVSPDTNRPAVVPLLAFAPAAYEAVHHGAQVEVTASVPFQVLRPGDAPVPLFSVPIHLRAQALEGADGDWAAFATVSNRPALLAQKAGRGTLKFSYRVPVETRDGRQRVQIPLVPLASGDLRLESPRADVQNLNGSLWAKRSAEGKTIHELGVAGEDRLVLEWRPAEDSLAGEPAARPQAIYGIGITAAQHLTVIGSDGSCTHFAEFDLPATPDREFHLRLPAQAKLVSVSVNGLETTAPMLDGQSCRLRLPEPSPSRTTQRLSFRIACAPVRLGFLGAAELPLPETFLTTGSVRWTVALPAGFAVRIIASGLETQKTPPDLGRFGDYGRLVNPAESLHLAKELAPPGPVTLALRYRQAVPGWQ